MGPRTGELNKRVRLRRSIAATNLGQVEITSGVYADVWAAIEPLSGREFISADRLIPDASMMIRIRWRSDVRPSDSVLLEDNGQEYVYEIAAVLNQDTRHEELHLVCRETVTA